MNRDIEAIFLDVGNTLRVVVEDGAFQAQARQQLVELVGAGEAPEEFHQHLKARYKVYRKLAKETLTEASEAELWTRHMLPDLPAERIAPLAGRLTRLWRDCDGRRIPRPDVKDTVIELSRRGYRLAIVANTITETEIPDWLAEDGLVGYFAAVVLSAQVGLRKPGPEIFQEAARRTGVELERTAYVGDNPSRDVVGARRAGLALSIIIRTSKLEEEPAAGEREPDLFISQLSELLQLFPPRGNGHAH